MEKQSAASEGAKASGVQQRDPRMETMNLNKADVLDFLNHLKKLDTWPEDGRGFLELALAKAAGCGWLEELQRLAKIKGLPPGPDVASAAAAKNHLSVLQWICGFQSLQPPDVFTCIVAAAEAGHQVTVAWLRQQYPACSSVADACIKAAHVGSLKALELLIAMDKSCLLDNMISLTAWQEGHWQVVEWLALQPGFDPQYLADFAAKVGCLDTFVILQRCAPAFCMTFEHMSLLVGHGDFEALRLLEPQIRALDKQDLLHLFMFVVMGSSPDPGFIKPQGTQYPMRPRQPPFKSNHLASLEWLFDLEELDMTQKDRAHLFCLATECCSSILPVQLAAKTQGHDILWSAATHSRAAAFGDLALLQWLVTRPVAADYQVVHEDCSDTRMLLLVHKFGWTLPDTLAERLATTERCHFALLNTVRQLRKQASPGIDAGDLPNALVKKIGCMADLDFSWAFSD